MSLETMVNVLFISPGKSAFKKPRKAPLPPYQLMTVAGLTPKGVGLELIDEAVQDVPFDTTADIVAISANWSSRAYRAYGLSDIYRKKGKWVVLGGAHVTALPDEALTHADTIIIGQAEEAWPQFINDYIKGSPKKVYKSMQPSLEGIQPRRDLIDHSKYWTTNVVQTTRGCPFDCDFCSVSVVYGNKYRHRPISDVLAEIDTHKGRELLFLDDNISGDPKYAQELFEALKPRRREWFAQTDWMIVKKPKLLDLAAESGCNTLFVGFEGLNSASLKGVGKPWNKPEEFEGVVRAIHDRGIAIVGAFILGLDEDKQQDIDETVQFTRKNGIEIVQYSVPIPLPGTRFFQRLAANGRIDPDTLDYDLLDGMHVTYEPKGMTGEELQQAFHKAYEKTYSFFSSLYRSRRYPKGHLPVNLAFWNHYRGITKNYRAVREFLQSPAVNEFVESIHGKANSVRCYFSEKGENIVYEAHELKDAAQDRFDAAAKKLRVSLKALRIPKHNATYVAQEISGALRKMTGMNVSYEPR